MDFITKEKIELIANSHELDVLVNMYENAWDYSGTRDISLYFLKNKKTDQKDLLINRTLTIGQYNPFANDQITIARGQCQLNEQENFNQTLKELKSMIPFNQISTASLHSRQAFKNQDTYETLELLTTNFPSANHYFSVKIN